ncbi:enolase-phosphatase E1-like isoform X3 [Dysidea avara]|uniref:enolase-phosphatase E1-like isoform X3 n=1 Tax=Dysidea avara TaxID=196820 RepID=UPI00332B8C42
MSHAVFHSDTDISVGKRKNWVKSVTNSLFRCKLAQKFGSAEELDKENKPMDVKVSVTTHGDSDDSDNDRGPDPTEIVLNMDSLRKFHQIVDPDFDLDEVESRGRLDSHAAYDRAILARAQQRRLPGKVANVTQCRPSLAVSKSESHLRTNRSNSYGGYQLSSGTATLDAEEQILALSPDERQRQIIAKLKEQSSNPLAGLARALKHGPRRSFGKSRHADGDSPKLPPVTKPKPKTPTKPSTDEKEEKTGGFLFRRRSFNERKGSDDDSIKGSPKVSKKFGLKIGGGGNKKPPVRAKPAIASSSTTGEEDSILSEDISEVSSSGTIASPSKSFGPSTHGNSSIQKTSTPHKGGATPPTREKTPGERDSSLYKDPPPLFGHRSVLLGSADIDAIFEKYSQEDAAANAKASGDDSIGSTKPSNKPTPHKKPEITAAKPNMRDRNTSSSDDLKSPSRVLAGKAFFERQKPVETAPPKSSYSKRSGIADRLTSYEQNARSSQAKKEEEKETKVKEDASKKTSSEEDSTTMKKASLWEEEKSTEEVLEVDKTSDTKEDKKKSLFDDYEVASTTAKGKETEAMETDKTTEDKKNLFDDYEVAATAKNDKPLFEEIDEDDKLFGDVDIKKDSTTAATITAKKTVYDELFASEEPTTRVQRSGSLFDQESDEDDELFGTTKKSQKKDASLEILDLSKSPSTVLAEKKAKEVKPISPLADEDESPLFGKPKSPSTPSPSIENEDKKSFEEEEKKVVEEDKEPVEEDKEPVEEDKEPVEEDKEPVEEDKEVVVEEKAAKPEETKEESPSPELFKKPTSPGSPLFDDEAQVQRSTSIFEGKRSKSEEELFQIDQKPDEDSVMKESAVSGGYLLVDVEKRKERSSLFDDELLFDDSEIVSTLDKETKEKSSFSIDDFVMIPDVSSNEPVSIEDTTADPLSDKKIDSTSEVALEEFPPKESTIDEEQDEPIKPKSSGIHRENSAELAKAAVDKKKNTPSREDKKPPTEDKPAWLLEAQRRKERRLQEKEKEKEKKQMGVKDSPKRSASTESSKPLADIKLKKSTVATSSVAKKAPIEEDIPEWKKKLKERRQHTTDLKKPPLSSSKETTTTTSYVSRRERLRDAKETTTNDNKMVDNDKKKTDDEKVDNKKEEQKEKDEEEQKPKEVRDKKSKSPSPLQDKPPLSPKPKLEDLKSPSATTKPSTSSSKPELKKKPSVEVTISSVRQDVRRPSGDQDKEKSPAKEAEASPVKTTTASKDKKTVAVSSKVITTSRTASTSSEDSVPKWKKDLAQQKKTEKLSVERTSREASVTSPTPDSIPEWKRKLLEKRKQKRTPSPTDDTKEQSAAVKIDKQTSSDKPNYRSMLSTRTGQGASATTITTTTTSSPSSRRKNVSTANKEVPEFMKEFKLKRRNSLRDSKS